ncbi:MAG: hypothetical protein GY757_39005, partial [bacterium]|nr:hypothetical protein [bacterium]
MTNDLEIIKRLGKKIGIEFKKAGLEEIERYERIGTYAVNEENRVIGLNLALTKLTIGPGELLELPGLVSLNLAGNQLSDISFLKDLSNLTILDLSSNQLSDISFLKELSNLTTLDLGSNQLSDISSLKDLTNLTTLVLYINQLSDITALKDLAKLNRLDLDDNKIKHLPRWVVNWDMEMNWGGSTGLSLEANPLETPPLEIVKEGKKAVIEYFKAMDGEKKALNEVKVLLVGDGGAGKTSL